MGNNPSSPNPLDLLCAPGAGASRAEKHQGSAVTGKFNSRVIMKEHVWCQQMTGGLYPGNKFLQFTPAGVAALVTAKEAKEAYMNFKVEIAVR